MAIGFGKGIDGDIGQKTRAELDTNLILFYAEARNEDRDNYSRSILLGFIVPFELPNLHERHPHS